MRIILQRHATTEGAQHHGPLLALRVAHLDKEATALIRQVVEVDAALILLALS